MDKEGFQTHLKRGVRSPSAQKRAIAYVEEYERYLQAERDGIRVEKASVKDLDAFVEWLELAPKTSAKKHLWALRYYYDYAGNEQLRLRAGELRQQRIKPKPFALGQFRGVDARNVQRLEAVGIRNAEQMLEAGCTPSARQGLADRTGVPLDAVLELVKLSDLARLDGVKAVRARLYYDAGVDTLAKMAEWDPEELRAALVAFVDRTGFDGIAPLPREARNAVKTAGELPKMVVY
jgi:hypothetical protein